MLDFEVCQGVRTLSSQVQDSERLGLGALAIQRQSETVPVGVKVYCNRFFMTVPVVDHMLKKQVHLTGTVMKNWVPNTVRNLLSDLT